MADHSLQQQEEARLGAILNETMRRVHTVMAKHSETLARGRPEQALTFEETQAVLNGAVSGIAAFAAMMHFVRNPHSADQRTPEEWLADTLHHQFVEAFRLVAAQVESANRAAEGGMVS